MARLETETKFKSASARVTAGFLSRAGADTPLNFRAKFRVFPRTILENLSGVDTQTAVLVSTAEVWISAPDTQTTFFWGFSGYPQLTLAFLPGDENFRIFFLGCLSRKSGSQHQLRIKTLPSERSRQNWGPVSWCCQNVIRPEKLQNESSPEFFELSSRILPRSLLRIFAEFLEEFSCFASWETETRKDSPKIPAIFQCKIPRQIREKKKIHRIFLGSGQSKILGATSIENTTGSDPCGQPHCILLCLFVAMRGEGGCRGGGWSNLVVFLSEDHETGPRPRATGRPRDGTPVFPGPLALVEIGPKCFS